MAKKGVLFVVSTTDDDYTARACDARKVSLETLSLRRCEKTDRLDSY